ncbi:DEKNAAC102501 [Brettanomyces naardenensis]|uniref:UDP-galactose transporter homolog 1 n=1 Tax=Brettanomyces naardenensis TaxID=13370 RepID=A0A448YK74_BRENA|nr:DEKNAAC102501 [Brettanomyces naardenensis]
MTEASGVETKDRPRGSLSKGIPVEFKLEETSVVEMRVDGSDSEVQEAEEPGVNHETKPSPAPSSPSIFLLVFCCMGIYSSFLTWSYLQEKISSKNYSAHLESPAYFKATLVVNAVQSFFAIIVGTLYLSVKTGRVAYPTKFMLSNLDLFPRFLFIALSQSISSPIAYRSLNHVDYLFYLLAKSCKLIPVMVVHWLMYGSRFPLYKYLAAVTITVGVLIFTLGATSSGKRESSPNDGNTLLGLSQLMLSLMLDGYTNSTQDELFKLSSSADRKGKEKLTGGHLMAILNFLNFVITSINILCFTSQWSQFTGFISQNGLEVLFDIVGFGLLGALGQVFIFITLEQFSSIVLVTVTVTRKMLSMCLSVFLFGHRLQPAQWVGLGLGFAGILTESIFKLKPKKIKTV